MTKEKILEAIEQLESPYQDDLRDIVEFTSREIPDTAYEFIDEFREDIDNIADNKVPVYNSDVLDWYQRDLYRLPYADEVIAEYGNVFEYAIDIFRAGISKYHKEEIEEYVKKIYNLINKENE